MTKKYYKDVICTNDDYYSAIVRDIKLRVKYKIGEWVYPMVPGSKLMVFDDLVEALNFLPGHLFIYECDVIKPSRIGPFISWTYLAQIDGDLGIRKLIKLCQLKLRKKKYTHLMSHNPPPRTIFVDAVKLTKRVR